MYTIVPFRRAFDSAFAPLFNDHFMREFFDASNAPEMRACRAMNAMESLSRSRHAALARGKVDSPCSPSMLMS